MSSYFPYPTTASNNRRLYQKRCATYIYQKHLQALKPGMLFNIKMKHVPSSRKGVIVLLPTEMWGDLKDPFREAPSERLDYKAPIFDNFCMDPFIMPANHPKDSLGPFLCLDVLTGEGAMKRLRKAHPEWKKKENCWVRAPEHAKVLYCNSETGMNKTYYLMNGRLLATADVEIEEVK